jgi:hypothetical protein
MLHDHGKNECEPKRLRAYMFAERKSHSHEVAPSGVRQDMLVVFMTCFRYSRGSLMEIALVFHFRSKMEGDTHDRG